MQHISASALETDLPARISYLSSFLNLSESDGEALLASAPLIAPLIPAVLDLVYSKLLSYDITAQVFVPKNTGYEGEVVKTVQELTLESPQIAYRKDFLKVRDPLFSLSNSSLVYVYFFEEDFVLMIDGWICRTTW